MTFNWCSEKLQFLSRFLWRSVEVGAPERGPVLRSHPQKRRPLGSHLWRMSSPVGRPPAQTEGPATLQKSQSVQNLALEGRSLTRSHEISLKIPWYTLID